MAAPTAGTVICVGLGTIGAIAVEQLVRLGVIKRIVLVDPDRYAPHNLASQPITKRDVGRPKIAVLAQRVRRIAPALSVTAMRRPVQQVPLGLLRSDLILTSTDNLASRRYAVEAAGRLGIPCVDAGVRAEGQLVRVDVYAPGPGTDCVECALLPAERAALSARYPCDPAPDSPATGAPAYLGTAAAALQVAEAAKLLGAAHGPSLRGRQVMLDVENHAELVTRRRPAPDCRCDRRPWVITALAQGAGGLSVAAALRLPGAGRNPGAARLTLGEDAFAHALYCPHCGESRPVLYLWGRLDQLDGRCARCGGPLTVRGLDVTDSIGAEHCAGRRRLSLHAIGMRRGDVFSVHTAEGTRHYEIGGR